MNVLEASALPKQQFKGSIVDELYAGDWGNYDAKLLLKGIDIGTAYQKIQFRNLPWWKRLWYKS